MSATVRATIPGLFISLSVQVASLPVNASDEQAEIMAQCRQEVAEYGIPAEQAAEYVDGCFMSKGGYAWPGPQDQDIATGEAESLPEGQPVNGMNETLALPESNNGVR